MREGSKHLKPKLRQFPLNIRNNLLLEHLAFLEDLVHAHSGNNHPSLTLDNALNNILNMSAAATVGLTIDIACLTGEQRGVFL